MIKEANEICQAMGKNIRFKPVLIKQAYDPEGRKMTIAGGNAKFEDELSVQVEDMDLKITMMWSIDDFTDKLDMMRNAYAQFQNMQFSKTHDASILKTVDKEVFNSNASKTMSESFSKNFMANPEEDVSQMFQ